MRILGLVLKLRAHGTIVQPITIGLIPLEISLPTEIGNNPFIQLQLDMEVLTTHYNCGGSAQIVTDINDNVRDRFSMEEFTEAWQAVAKEIEKMSFKKEPHGPIKPKQT